MVFIDRHGKIGPVQHLTAADWQDATALRRMVLSLAVNNKATSVQPFTFHSDDGDPEAVGEALDLSSPILAMRPFLDFEIRDHLGVVGDGRWRAGGQSGRLDSRSGSGQRRRRRVHPMEKRNYEGKPCWEPI